MKTKVAVKSVNSFFKLRNAITKRVERGVRFLDQEFGRRDWLYKIDLAQLDLESPTVCVLGQTFPDHFEEGCDRLEDIKGSEVDEGQYGFNVIKSLQDAADSKKYQQYFDILQSIWVAKIKKYRAALESPKIKSLEKLLANNLKKAETVI